VLTGILLSYIGRNNVNRLAIDFPPEPKVFLAFQVSIWLNREEDNSLMLLPTLVSHKIDAESPFYDLTPEKLAESNFELVSSVNKVFSGKADAGNPN
jgi:hypothetical protein